jgi:hypothetical protein
MSDDDSECSEEEHLPWEDIEASRHKNSVQRGRDSKAAKGAYGAIAHSCPNCQKPPDALAWFYFDSPSRTWADLCGRAGWITVCDECKRQVDFFCEVMN